MDFSRFDKILTNCVYACHDYSVQSNIPNHLPESRISDFLVVQNIPDQKKVTIKSSPTLIEKPTS